MDTSKLSGIVDAIEAESKLPSPSHSNLARLVAMGFNEVKALFLLPKISSELELPTSVQASESDSDIKKKTLKKQSRNK